MENKVVHIRTQIQSVFGILDKDGDVVQELVVQADPQKVDPLLIRKLVPEAFSQAFSALVQTKEAIQKQVDETGQVKTDVVEAETEE